LILRKSEGDDRRALVGLAPGQHAREVRNHWWWRPGWRTGRRFYALHITLADQPELHRLADAYRASLTHEPALTLIPNEWLHLTMQGLGFTNEVSTEAVHRVAEQARRVLADCPAVEVEFRSAVVGDEAIALPAEPAGPVQQLRAAVHAAIGRVLGVDLVPEDPHRYRPHASVAYITASRSAEPYVQAVTAVDPAPARVRISHVDLIEMHRDHRMYEWTVHTRLPLG
jgi:2'-5' RNA ligase